MAFKMKHKLTSYGLKNRLNTPLYQNYNENIDPPGSTRVVSDEGGVKTLQRTTTTGQPGTYQSTGIEFEDSWNNMPEEKKKKFNNFEDYKRQALEYIAKKKRGTQREVVEEKQIITTDTQPQYETVQETVTMPLFGNKDNYNNFSWDRLTGELQRSNRMTLPAVFSQNMNSRKAKYDMSLSQRLKASYDEDPLAFEKRLRQFYPNLFTSKTAPKGDIIETKVETTPGSQNVEETDWSVISDTTTEID